MVTGASWRQDLHSEAGGAWIRRPSLFRAGAAQYGRGSHPL